MPPDRSSRNTPPHWWPLHRQISPKLARRVDAEDIVQSTYRSLFVRLKNGEFELGSGRDLWNLLVTIVLNKVRRQAKFHRATRRNMASEQSVRHEGLETPVADDGPGPEDAAILVDELEHFLAKLPPRDRPIVELRLQGCSTAEIAEATGRAERSVRRIVERARGWLEKLVREP